MENHYFFIGKPSIFMGHFHGYVKNTPVAQESHLENTQALPQLQPGEMAMVFVTMAVQRL